jgi:hypothetical protein
MILRDSVFTCDTTRKSVDHTRSQRAIFRQVETLNEVGDTSTRPNNVEIKSRLHLCPCNECPIRASCRTLSKNVEASLTRKIRVTSRGLSSSDILPRALRDLGPFSPATNHALLNVHTKHMRPEQSASRCILRTVHRE